MAADLSIVVRLQDKASGPIGALRGKLGKVASVGGKILKAGMLAGAAGITAAGLAAFKFGNDFKEAENIIRVGTGTSGAALDALNEDFKNAFKDVPADMKDVATATADLNTRLGLTGSPLVLMTKQFVELSRITGTDVASNIKTVTRVFGDWSVATEDQAGELDRLFRISQSTGIGVDRLSQLVVQFGAPLRGFGFTLAESTALLAKFEKEGVNTEAVMGGLKIGLGKVAAAGKDPATEFAKVSEAIKNAGSAGEANIAAIELFGSRAGPDMAAAIREGRFEVEDFIKQMDAGGDGILATAKATETWREKLKRLRNKVLVKLEPLMVGLVDQVGKLADWIELKLLPAIEKWWKKHGPKVMGFIRDVKGGVRDIGRVLGDTLVPAVQEAGRVFIKMFGFLRDNKEILAAVGIAILAVLVPGIVAWTVATLASVAAHIALAAATLLAYAPILLLIAGIALLAFGIIQLVKHWDDVTAALGKFKDFVFDAFKGIKEDVMGIVDGIVAFLKEHWKEIVLVALSILFPPAGGLFFIITHFGEIKDKVIGIAEDLWNALLGAGGWIVNIAKDIVSTIAGIPGKIAGLASDFFDAASDLGSQIIEGLKDGIGAVAGIAQDIANTVGTAIKRLINTQIIDKINRALEFEIKGPFGLGTVKIDPPDIPRLPTLQEGGEVLHTGLAVVHEGERFSRGGASVTVQIGRLGTGVTDDEMRAIARRTRRIWEDEFA